MSVKPKHLCAVLRFKVKNWKKARTELGQDWEERHCRRRGLAGTFAHPAAAATHTAADSTKHSENRRAYDVQMRSTAKHL